VENFQIAGEKKFFKSKKIAAKADFDDFFVENNFKIKIFAEI